MNYRQYKKRRKNRMYVDTFNLDYNISKYILPRLKIFRETHITNTHRQVCGVSPLIYNNIVSDIDVLDYPYSEHMDSKSTLGDLMEKRIEPCLVFASKKLENCTIKVFPNFLKL